MTSSKLGTATCLCSSSICRMSVLRLFDSEETCAEVCAGSQTKLLQRLSSANDGLSHQRGAVSAIALEVRAIHSLYSDSVKNCNGTRKEKRLPSPGIESERDRGEEGGGLKREKKVRRGWGQSETC